MKTQNKMNILVGCEESQAVTIELRKLGHEAYSCDIQECSGGHPEWHLKMDIFEAIKLKEWHMLIAFPDCTYLTVTANKWYKDQPERKSGTLVGQARREARGRAVEFFMRLVNCGIPKIALENPIGVMSTEYRRPDQVIQPFHYGHKERKSTCLWLHNLPKLIATEIVEPEFYIAAGKKYSPTHYNSKSSLNRLDSLSPGPERSKLRSKTYPGIAKAMADQWSKLILIIFIVSAFNLSAQKIEFTHFNDLSDFDKHRVVSTSIAWTGTIVGYKATGKIWKGALIGLLASAIVGGFKEVVYDGAMHRGVPSWKDTAGNSLGGATGTIAGVMCCGLRDHMQARKEELRQSKFINPLN